MMAGVALSGPLQLVAQRGERSSKSRNGALWSGEAVAEVRRNRRRDCGEIHRDRGTLTTECALSAFSLRAVAWSIGRPASANARSIVARSELGKLPGKSRRSAVHATARTWAPME